MKSGKYATLTSQDVSEIVAATHHKLNLMHRVLRDLAKTLRELPSGEADRVEAQVEVVQEYLQPLADAVLRQCTEGSVLFAGDPQFHSVVGLASDLIDQSGHFPPDDLVRSHRQESPRWRNSIEATDAAFVRFASRMQQMTARHDGLTVREVLIAAGRQFAEFGGHASGDLLEAFEPVWSEVALEDGCIVDELRERLQVEVSLLRKAFAMAQPLVAENVDTGVRLTERQEKRAAASDTQCSTTKKKLGSPDSPILQDLIELWKQQCRAGNKPRKVSPFVEKYLRSRGIASRKSINSTRSSFYKYRHLWDPSHSD